MRKALETVAGIKLRRLVILGVHDDDEQLQGLACIKNAAKRICQKHFTNTLAAHLFIPRQPTDQRNCGIAVHLTIRRTIVSSIM